MKKSASYWDNRRELAETYPIGCIMPLHGVVVSGSDLHMAYSMLERIEQDVCAVYSKTIYDHNSGGTDYENRNWKRPRCPLK